MVISRTPFRISFFGGGTDYPSWYRAHGGAVLATTIDKYCYLTCRYLPPFFERGLELHHDGDLPARSGMGSSSAFTVGLLHALHALRGEMASKMQLTRESIHLEQEVLQETVGSQDQVMAAYGGFRHVKFHANGQIAIDPLILPAPRF